MKLKKFKVSYLLAAVISIFMIAALTNNGAAGPKGGGFLGVYLEDFDDDLREAIDYKGEGAYVEDVVDDSPAEKAGIEAGDIIIEFNGKEVEDAGRLRKMIGKSEPGTKVKFTVVRDGKKKTLKAELGERKEMEKRMFIVSPGGKKKHIVWKDADMIFSGGSDRGFLGVKLQEMPDQLAEYFGVEDGALIGEVVKDTPAEKAGLKAGDVIVKFDSRRVDDKDDLHYFMGKTEPEDEVEIIVNRKGKEQKFKVKLGECPNKCNLINMQGLHDGDIDFDFDLDHLEDLDEHLKDIQIEFDTDDGKKETWIKLKTKC